MLHDGSGGRNLTASYRPRHRGDSVPPPDAAVAASAEAPAEAPAEASAEVPAGGADAPPGTLAAALALQARVSAAVRPWLRAATSLVVTMAVNPLHNAGFMFVSFALLAVVTCVQLRDAELATDSLPHAPSGFFASYGAWGCDREAFYEDLGVVHEYFGIFGGVIGASVATLVQYEGAFLNPHMTQAKRRAASVTGFVFLVRGEPGAPHAALPALVSSRAARACPRTCALALALPAPADGHYVQPAPLGLVLGRVLPHERRGCDHGAHSRAAALRLLDHVHAAHRHDPNVLCGPAARARCRGLRLAGARRHLRRHGHLQP